MRDKSLGLIEGGHPLPRMELLATSAAFDEGDKGWRCGVAGGPKQDEASGPPAAKQDRAPPARRGDEPYIRLHGTCDLHCQEHRPVCNHSTPSILSSTSMYSCRNLSICCSEASQ